MDLKFEEAFSFVKQDKDWKKKIGIGGALSILAVILCVLPFLFLKVASASFIFALFVVCAVSNAAVIFALIGYPYVAANNLINNSEEILPEWNDFGKLIFTGFKSSIGYCLYSIPLALAYVIILGLFACVAFVDDSIVKLAALIFIFLLIFIIAALSMLYMLISYLMIGTFSRDLKVLSFVNFKSAFETLKKRWLNYLLLFLLIIAVGVIAQFAMLVLTITIVGAITLPWIVFYISLVSANLIAQYIKVQDAKQ